MTSRNNPSVKQGLSKNQKLAITAIASLVGITAIGLTIWGVKKYLSSKDDPSKNKDNEDNNKENNEDIKAPSAGDAKKLNKDSPEKVKTQEQIYDQNIEMIKKNSGLDEKIIDQLIKIMNNKDSISKHLDMIT